MLSFKERVLLLFYKIPVSISSKIKRNTDIWLFGAWFGEKYGDNSKALFLYMLQRKTTKHIIWVTKNKEVYNKLKMEGITVLKSISVKGLFYQLRAGVFFSCTGCGDFFSRLLGGAYQINLWHGVGGGKKIGYDAGWYDKEYDKKIKQIQDKGFKNSYYIATSNEMKKVFKTAFHVDDEHVIMAGQPRNDMFFDPKYKITTIDTAKFTGKTVITYLPTHRLESGGKIQCSKIFNLNSLNSFCENNNCIFIIKKHFYHKNEVEELDKYCNILDWTSVPDIDTNELLMVSDYLISDYSSVTADYLLLNRPIFYYCYDLDNYLKKDRDIYWSYDEITPGPKCRTFDELISSLKTVIVEDKDDYTSERERVLSIFYGTQARKAVSQDIFDAVEKIVLHKRKKI